MSESRADGIIQYEIITGCQSDSPNAKKWALDSKLVNASKYTSLITTTKSYSFKMHSNS